MYNQGQVINTKSATTLALVGGSAEKSGGGRVVQAGILPRNNERLVVMEEVQDKGNDEYYRYLTDIKSRNVVRIERVGQAGVWDCNVRLIEISNPKTGKGTQTATSVKNFKDGYQAIQMLIHNPEDIARNDIYLTKTQNELKKPQDQIPLDLKPYRERINWIWSRTKEQIKFENEDTLWEQAQILNKKFNCASVPLLGAEGYQKLARMSAALAGVLCSTMDYETIYVKNEHIIYIRKWIEKIYTNMGIDIVVANERSYSEIKFEDTVWLQNQTTNWSDALNFLYDSMECSPLELATFSGSNVTTMSAFIAELNKRKFVKRLADGHLQSTIKFKETYKQLNDKYDVVKELPLVTGVED